MRAPPPLSTLNSRISLQDGSMFGLMMVLRSYFRALSRAKLEQPNPAQVGSRHPNPPPTPGRRWFWPFWPFWPSVV